MSWGDIARKPVFPVSSSRPPGSRLDSPAAKIAPKMETPTEPPIMRNIWELAVATPSAPAGTAFWIAATPMLLTGPIQMRADRQQGHGQDGHYSVAARPAHEDAGQDGPADESEHQGQQQQAGNGRAVTFDDL